MIITKGYTCRSNPQNYAKIEKAKQMLTFLIKNNTARHYLCKFYVSYTTFAVPKTAILLVFNKLL